MAGLGVERGQWIDAPHGTCGQGTGLSSLLGGATDQQPEWLWAWEGCLRGFGHCEVGGARL